MRRECSTRFGISAGVDSSIRLRAFVGVARGEVSEYGRRVPDIVP